MTALLGFIASAPSPASSMTTDSHRRPRWTRAPASVLASADRSWPRPSRSDATGAALIELTAYHHRPEARHLYESLGYDSTVTAYLRKKL